MIKKSSLTIRFRSSLKGTGRSLSRRRFISGTAGAIAAAVSGFFPGMAPIEESFMDGSDYGPMPFPAPDWLRNAVIIEVPTRGFNVSDYKNPDNWKSPYGDTTYKSITAKLDFLNSMGINVLCLYSVYNCTPGTNLYALRYTEQNPDMGTLDDVKKLIREAHARGMYIISNTNHYGVDQTSPLLSEHPDWFLQSTMQKYGQRVFDINNKEARKYIIDNHVWWCTDVGLDGWRIDIASEVFKKSIWSEIMTQCAKRGKRILLATEWKHLTGYIQGSGMHGFDPIHDMTQLPTGRNKFYLGGATVNDPYRCKEISGHNCGSGKDKPPCFAFNNKQSGCLREGCHRIKGSRFLFGHNSMFAPMVPWMMAGETFNATHLGIPGSNFASKMLHSYLDWTDVESQKNVADDFRKISKIRTDNMDIFHNNQYETKLINVPCTSNPLSPVKPYARYLHGKKAGIVIGNNSTTDDVTFTLQIPLGAMGMDILSELYVTDCWNNTTVKVSRSALGSYSVLVPKDRSEGGGVRVLIITGNDKR